MKRGISFLPTLLFSVLVLLSCSKDEELVSIYSSNIVPSDKVSATSFTAVLTGSYDGIDKIELGLGTRGVLYSVKKDGVETMFKEWLDGNDDCGCEIFDKAEMTGETLKCSLLGLNPDTEYSFCIFLQKRDGTRLISSISSFRTQPFSPDIKEVALNGVQCCLALADCSVSVNEKDAAYCNIGLIVSGQRNCSIENSSSYVYDGSSLSKFSLRLDKLESNKNYYCRLYVKYPVSSGQYAYVYGPESEFKTKDLREVAVNLGLPSGNLWAAYNVGAESPEEYGDYFAWGETQPKDTYSYNNYKWRNNNKYNTDTTSVNVSSYKCIEPSDDAANYNWGGNWRIPSNADLDELYYYCYSYLDTINGVIGNTFESEVNGNTIFIPFAGYKDLTLTQGAESFVVLSSRDLYYANYSDGFWVWKQEKTFTNWDDFWKKYSIGRQTGLVIRPVYLNGE